MIKIIGFSGYLSLLVYTFDLLKKHRGRILATFEIMTNNKRLTVGGVLVALAALLHAAPVFLPGLGLALSPLSSIPILIGAMLFADQVLAIFVATTCLLFFINAKEATIFLLATGPLGLSAALATISGRHFWKSLFVSASLLTSGIYLLVFILGLPGLQNIMGTFSLINLLLIVLFSLAYSLLFANIALFLQKRLEPLFVKKQSTSNDEDQLSELKITSKHLRK